MEPHWHSVRVWRTRGSKGYLMEELADSIVVKRLVRYLQYKRTYIRVFESFLEPELHPAVVDLLHALVSAQQAAVGPLSGYLRDLGFATQARPLNQSLGKPNELFGSHDSQSFGTPRRPPGPVLRTRRLQVTSEPSYQPLA